MQRHDVAISPKIAEAIGLPSFAREVVASTLADIGGLRSPTRSESVEFLVATLRQAAHAIPTAPAAWSWGEFHHAGIYPAHVLIRADDPVPVALCAADLGLADLASPASADTPRRALSLNLMSATEQLLRNLHERIEAAGISPHGHQGLL